MRWIRVISCKARRELRRAEGFRNQLKTLIGNWEGPVTADMLRLLWVKPMPL